MRQRSISAIGIVILGLLPAFLGGWIFTVAFTAIALVACREVAPLLEGDRSTLWFGSTLIVLAAVMAMLDSRDAYFPLLITLAVLVPLTATVFTGSPSSNRRDWTVPVGAGLYVALPTYAAISLRTTAGSVDREWFQAFSDAMPGADTTTLGLGLFLTALLVTWLSDTAAYLVGKSVGRTRLIPRVSPNKTVEGAVGGLIAAGVTAAVCDVSFGLGIGPFTAALLGILLGAIGMFGDLSESMLKRRAGVKDSGNLIPGHGGVLDRIDALLFVVAALWGLLPIVI